MAESRGILVVTIRNADCGRVLQGATVSMSCERGSCTGVSDTNGVVSFSIPTPSVANSYTPKPRERPYTAVDLRIVLAGYVTVSIVGEQVFSSETTRQTVMMGTLDRPSEDGTPMQLERVIVIPQHHLYTGSDEPRVENLSEPEPASSNSPEALPAMKRAPLPSAIRVHEGPPDAEAPTVKVPFSEYMKNVASSQLYPTWPEQSLRNNIEKLAALVLDRLRTNQYPSQGYAFDITDSPAYDLQYVHDRGLFDRICRLVDEWLSENGGGSPCGWNENE
ncbi:MAG: hypothetical protein J1E00_00790 [Oscillospiraceae bacterium]|nr:hypothetical protein [Oscillospiraceae bacterium]